MQRFIHLRAISLFSPACGENEAVRWEIISLLLAHLFFWLKLRWPVLGNVQYVFITEIIRMYSTGKGSLIATLVCELLEDFLIKSRGGGEDSDEMSFIGGDITTYCLSFHKKLYFNQVKGAFSVWTYRCWSTGKMCQCLSCERRAFNQLGVSCKIDSGFIIRRIRNNTDKPCNQSSSQTSRLCVNLPFIFAPTSAASGEWHSFHIRVTMEISKPYRFGCPCSSDHSRPFPKRHALTERAKQTF